MKLADDQVEAEVLPNRPGRGGLGGELLLLAGALVVVVDPNPFCRIVVVDTLRLSVELDESYGSERGLRGHHHEGPPANNAGRLGDTDPGAAFLVGEGEQVLGGEVGGFDHGRATWIRACSRASCG